MEHIKKSEKERYFHSQQIRLQQMNLKKTKDISADKMIDCILSNAIKSNSNDSYLLYSNKENFINSDSKVNQLDQLSSTLNTLNIGKSLSVSNEASYLTLNNNNTIDFSTFSSNFKNIPKIYQQVWDLVKISNSFLCDTKKLYPILLSSKLNNDLLARIWTQVNKTYPGQLTMNELFVALALIALNQKSSQESNLTSISNLKTLPTPLLDITKNDSLAVISQTYNAQNCEDLKKENIYECSRNIDSLDCFESIYSRNCSINNNSDDKKEENNTQLSTSYDDFSEFQSARISSVDWSDFSNHKTTVSASEEQRTNDHNFSFQKEMNTTSYVNNVFDKYDAFKQLQLHNDDDFSDFQASKFDFKNIESSGISNCNQLSFTSSNIYDFDDFACISSSICNGKDLKLNSSENTSFKTIETKKPEDNCLLNLNLSSLDKISKNEDFQFDIASNQYPLNSNSESILSFCSYDLNRMKNIPSAKFSDASKQKTKNEVKDKNETMKDKTLYDQFNDSKSNFKYEKQDIIFVVLQCCKRLMHKSFNILLVNHCEPPVVEALSSDIGKQFSFDLAEVYKVVKRISEAYDENNTSQGIKSLLNDINIIWQSIDKLLNKANVKAPNAYLPQNIIHLEISCDIEIEKGTKCAICNWWCSDEVTYDYQAYHASCANLWLNCINRSLPT